MSDAEQMTKSFKKQKFQNHGFGNTELTSFLAESVFSGNYAADQQKISTRIKELVALAASDVNARELLITPNNPHQSSRDMDPKQGVPLNTPLMLMVKAGDLECVKRLLPFYSRENLLTSTLRGNTVFHIAAITGQREILVALENQAQRLDMRDVLRTHRNNSDYTPYDMLQALFLRENSFKNFFDFSRVYLGGEEINKAACARGRENVCLYKQIFSSEPYRALFFNPQPGAIANTSSTHETAPSTLRI